MKRPTSVEITVLSSVHFIESKTKETKRRGGVGEDDREKREGWNIYRRPVNPTKLSQLQTLYYDSTRFQVLSRWTRTRYSRVPDFMSSSLRLDPSSPRLYGVTIPSETTRRPKSEFLTGQWDPTTKEVCLWIHIFNGKFI